MITDLGKKKAQHWGVFVRSLCQFFFMNPPLQNKHSRMDELDTAHKIHHGRQATCCRSFPSHLFYTPSSSVREREEEQLFVSACLYNTGQWKHMITFQDALFFCFAIQTSSLLFITVGHNRKWSILAACLSVRLKHVYCYMPTATVHATWISTD